jgi:hypothetical protein
MAHQFVGGLIDQAVQEKVLAKASDGQELSLKDLIGLVEAQEIGKRPQALLSGTGGLNRVSEYHKAKGGAKGVNAGEGAPPGGGGHQSGGWGGAPGERVVCRPKYGSCGQDDQGSSQAERAGKCPALGKECRKCKKLGHFSYCFQAKGGAVRAAGVAAAPVVPEVAQTGSVSRAMVEEGSFFNMSRSQDLMSALMEVLRQGEEAEAPGKPLQSLASRGVPARLGAKI